MSCPHLLSISAAVIGMAVGDGFTSSCKNVQAWTARPPTIASPTYRCGVPPARKFMS